MTHEEITALLHSEIVPVTGCTGPTAYALAAAACRPYVTGSILSWNVVVSPAYLKMGFGVATPGTSRTGIGVAAAAGFIGGDASLGLQAATKTNAELLLMADRIGTLEAGKLADVILVQGNPLNDIRIMCNADNIKLVIQDGRIVKDITVQAG